MTCTSQAPAIPFDPVVTAYLECALWSSTDEKQEPLGANYNIDDFSAEARETAESDCKDFVTANAVSLEGLSSIQIGHDFWLTRNRHGAGFWDRGLGPRGEYLTQMSHPYGGCDAYVGDDGRVHLQ
ncbi:hypothetical protein F6X40_34695 [Paraburkholderia sp. UCT31]|uniref:hypothetical protein n=1 Tax=Paraburkholderia sp. UCT31 TaxID=2615209 RepID=UPI001655B155|nr:hypothetical protein [Paraburkholderia sp. UCT31]MBC8741712.1 hypothetical protein [Paraburkholderia sp. UCT31]